MVAFLLAAFVGLAGPGLDATEVALAAYQPVERVGGVIRIWGSPTDADLLTEWGDGFKKFHPDAEVKLTLHGPESAMMGVYTGVAELALLAREMRMPAEHMAFTWAWRYPPTLVEVANAGVDTARPNGSLAVFVHPSNPLVGLTLAQLDGLYSAEHRRGAKNLRTWGDLGLTGEWQDRPVRVLGPAIDDVAALYFRHAVLADSYKWNAGLEEFHDEPAMLTSVAHDPDAIAYAPRHGAPAGLKMLPLARDDKGPLVAMTAENIVARTYPLFRAVRLVLNRKPGAPIEPRTKEFLSFVLSAEGQAIVAREGQCLPLSAVTVRAELKKLE